MSVVACSGCQTKYNVPDAAVGKTILCPKCKIPINTAMEAPAAFSPILPPVAPPPAVAPVVPPDRTAGPNLTRGGLALPLVLGVLGLAGVFFLGVLVLGVGAFYLAMRPDATAPATVSFPSVAAALSTPPGERPVPAPTVPKAPEPPLEPAASEDEITRLLGGLKGDGDAREHALETLRKLPPDAKHRKIVVAAVEKLLAPNPEDDHRAQAFGVLAVWGTAENLPTILKYAGVSEANPDVRCAAMEAAAAFRDERAASVILESADDFFIGERARSAVKRMGPAAEKGVIRLLQHANIEKRMFACGLLEVIGGKNSLAPLEQAAKDSNADFARAAVVALRIIAERTPGTAELLARLNPPGTALPDGEITQLVGELQQKDNGRRARALDKLREAAPDAKRRAEIVAAIEPLLPQGQEGGNRARGMGALARWHGRDATPTLIKYAGPTEPDAGVRASAMEALADLRDERGVEVVMQGVDDFFIGARAQLALKRMGASAETVVLKRLEDPDVGKRVAACRLLEVVGTKKSLPALERTSHDTNQDLAREAAAAIQAINDHGK